MTLLQEQPSYFRRSVLAFAKEALLPSRVTHASCGAQWKGPCGTVPPHLLVTLPCPTLALDSEALAESDPDAQRPIRVLAQWDIGTSPIAVRHDTRSKHLRTRLIRGMRAFNATLLPGVGAALCATTSSQGPCSVADNATAPSPNLTVSLLSQSTFCLEPAGDTPTRSHFYLAVLCGCIPVIFDGVHDTFGNVSRTPWAWREPGPRS